MCLVYTTFEIRSNTGRSNENKVVMQHVRRHLKQRKGLTYTRQIHTTRNDAKFILCLSSVCIEASIEERKMK